ncbi:MAG: hypothetical protein IJT94_13870, partial [Oscillibacter sp.]|nr:hypothetical protein [Oscillibacter sp.]
MRQGLWNRVALEKNLRREATMQDVLCLLLVFWAVMPYAMLGIRALVPRLPAPQAVLPPPSMTTRILSGYAKYFYALGLVSICAAIAVLFRALPGPRDLLHTARRQLWNCCLVFMLFWSVLSTLFSGNPISRFWGIRYHNDGLSSYFIYAAVYVCALMLENEKMRLLLLRLFSFIGSMCALIIFRQIYAAVLSGKSADNVGTAVFM